MARTKRWIIKYDGKGFVEIKLSSWKYYADFINSTMLNFRAYIFRGQGCKSWKLQTTIDRIRPKSDSRAIKEHLISFKYAVRGRRGPNPPFLKTEFDWWALGQHNGLATPLLDWTESPYVGAFFAYDQANNHDDDPAVWAIQKEVIEAKCNDIRNAVDENGDPYEIIQFFQPLSDENQRLVNQSALFSITPSNVDLQSWVAKHFTGHKRGILVKIILPYKDRDFALKSLNRMNINHATLFPDMYGAALLCNTKLSIPNY